MTSLIDKLIPFYNQLSESSLDTGIMLIISNITKGVQIRLEYRDLIVNEAGTEDRVTESQLFSTNTSIQAYVSLI